MSGFNRQFSSASPVLAITPLPSHQSRLSGSPFSHQRGHSSVSLHHSSLFSGRKRRRDEADSPSPSLQGTPKDWMSGEGISLLESGAHGGCPSDWHEPKDVIQETRIRLQASAAASRNYKSQRVDSTENLLAPILTSANAPTTGIPGVPANNAAQPVVDGFTLQLGIGWSKISDDEHIQAAARGWARFIENHYPLSNANILLESKGLQSYLVETFQGFFLFSEDLRRARLVSRDANGALRNLQQSPPIFEGTETLWRGDSPRSSQTTLDTPSPEFTMTLD